MKDDKYMVSLLSAFVLLLYRPKKVGSLLLVAAVVHFISVERMASESSSRTGGLDEKALQQ